MPANGRWDLIRRLKIKLPNGQDLHVFHSGLSEQSGVLGCDTETKGASRRFEIPQFIRNQGSPDRPDNLKERRESLVLQCGVPSQKTDIAKTDDSPELLTSRAKENIAL